MRKICLLLILVTSLSIPAAARWRRRYRPKPKPAPVATPTLYDIISFEGGIVTGYGLQPARIGYGRVFAVSLPLGKKTEAAYMRMSGDNDGMPTLNLLRLSVYTGKRTGFHFYSGADNLSEIAAGIGFFWDVFRENTGGWLKTLMQAQLGYIYRNGSGSPGVALLTLNIRFGY